ncbi:MAG: NTP transferase domain-containing protein, partial [Gammaproteobacteria bacterium]|nr:NTP transferase domain-containing protein [Gammaproteobacteria bacterium]NIY07808.1 NTP transferase domain-containing protein [Gemmatimonadota bacterium]
MLAAGRSRRMGRTNKLLAELDGVPLVRRVTATVIRAGLDPVVVVLGHDAGPVRASLDGLPVRFTMNERHGEGIGSSVAAGVRV